MRRSTMTNLITASIIFLFAAAIIGGVFIYNSVFPMAGPIPCPDINGITSISLGEDHDLTITVRNEDFSRILNNITSAQPTRTMSVNDSPSVHPYYRISIQANSREYRYYLYTDNGQVYIESPYDGVYKVDQGFLDYISGYAPSEPT